METQPLTESELQMWLTLMRGMAIVNRRLAQEMQQEHGCHISWYDVLVRLLHAPGQQMTMSELADSVVMSAGGLTRLLDRMVEEGLIERVLDPEDRRLVYARLTGTGRERAAELMQGHQQRIKEYVVQHLSEEEVGMMHKAFERILAHM